MVIEIPFVLYHISCISNKTLALIREKEGEYKRVYAAICSWQDSITYAVHPFNASLGAVYRPFNSSYVASLGTLHTSEPT